MHAAIDAEGMLPPCSFASRPVASLRPNGRLRRPGPDLRAASPALSVDDHSRAGKLIADLRARNPRPLFRIREIRVTRICSCWIRESA